MRRSRGAAGLGGLDQPDAADRAPDPGRADRPRVDRAPCRSQREVTSVNITDQGDGDALVADGALTSAVLEPAGGAPDFPRPLLLVAPPLEPNATPHLTEFLGTFPIDATTLGLEITDELRNPWGILHGGVTAALIDSVGCHATGGAATTDCVLHFLRPGRIGPVTASATRLGRRPDGDLVRVEVRDQGAENRLMAVAITTVR